MVFEYMEQDLDKFIQQSRLDHKLTKVIDTSIFTSYTLHFLWVDTISILYAGEPLQES